ncbi:MAG: selenocysteine-specific translation elongation factor [Pelolinea sp.]|nr:selenocysteine-specific translation elongation factor [Pelolinea sp.]
MYVIGTAGHVDHGKSTLISALTGINPDRLKEEIERQMTIDLGFAWYTLPSGEEIGIVDVPGHSDFIENMLAGVGGIDAVLFVISADEGIMPQSREHLDILKLLGIKLGLIVLTKIDLVEDQEWVDLVESDIRELVKHSFLEDAPILKVSAINGTGLSELSNCLDTVLKESAPKKDIHEPRLPIDRIFSIKGFGTIVTGTLLDGGLREGDQVEILPSGIKSRIRGIQNHKKKQQIAEPGNRTAINLVGVDVDQLQRGDVVCLPGQMRSTKRIDVEVELLKNKTSGIKHDDRLKVFIGSSQALARARVIDKKEIKPGENGWLQLEFEKALLVKRKDRFIIRRPSPAATIGGGYVLSAHPVRRHRRFSLNVVERYKTLSAGSNEDVILIHLLDLKVTELSQLIETCEINENLARETVEKLINEGNIVLFETVGKIGLSNMIASKKYWLEISRDLIHYLESYHKKFPLETGVSFEDASNKTGLSRKAISLVIEKLNSTGAIQFENGKIMLESHQIEFSSVQEKLISQLKKVFLKSPFLTPSTQECVEIVGDDIFSAMITKGMIVEVSSGVVFMTNDLTQIISETKVLLHEKQKISASGFRDHLKTSRKYAIALLEYMDKIGVTERIDDFRKLKNRVDIE